MEVLKNQVVIILDTTSETPLQIGKMEEAPHPDKQKEITDLDFLTVREALMVLIEARAQHGHPIEESVGNVIQTLQEAFPGIFEIS